MSVRANIASFLPELAKSRPDAVALLQPYGRDRDGKLLATRQTYAELDAESDAIARGLLDQGLTRGMRTVLMVPPSLEFFGLTFGLFKAGIVPVMVDPGMGVANLKACLAEARPEAFIGVPKAHLARVLLGWGRETIQHHVMVGPRLPFGGRTLRSIVANARNSSTNPIADTTDDETAAILFTSGSTGVPKGAVYTHGHFLGQVEMIRATYGIEPGEVDLPTFPLFALFDPAFGMTTVIPIMDFSKPASVDPHHLAACVAQFGVTNMFGSPAVIDKVGRTFEGSGHVFQGLKRVLSAGAPVPGQVLERFTKLLPAGVEVFTPYGATESLPVASIGSATILGETFPKTRQGAGVCVGRPVEGTRVDIIAITDEAILDWSQVRRCAPGEIGEIVATGRTVTREYFGRPQATALAKIRSEDGTVSHRIGDLGYFDSEGRLWYCGRKSHRVVTKSGTLFTDPNENIFNTHPAVRRTALVGVPRNGDVVPVLCVELETPVAESTLFAELAALAASHPQTQAIRTFLVHPKFPVDVRHNAKIFREKLAVWAAGRLP